MATTTVACPECGARLKVPDERIGTSGRCPSCKKTVKLLPPAQNLPVVRKPDRPPTVSPPRQYPVRPPEPEIIEARIVEKRQEVPCPFCHEMVLAEAKKCKHCRETLDPAMRAAEESRRIAELQTRERPHPVVTHVGAASAAATAKVIVKQPMGCMGCLGLIFVVLIAGLAAVYWIGSTANEEFEKKAKELEVKPK